MNLTELASWRQDHPTAPMYQCANINRIVHRVSYCSHRTFATRCGIKGDPEHHVLVFLLPLEMVTCKDCEVGNGSKK